MAEKENENKTSFMKFGAPTAPIFLEKPTGRMEPQPALKTAIVTNKLRLMINKLEREGMNNENTAKMMAIGTKLVQLETDSFDSEVNKEFGIDFILWLQGKSYYNTLPEKTPWLTKPLYKSPSVKAYIDQFADQKTKLNIKMTKLRMLPPQDIYEAWLYYKYIVREKEANPEDFFLESFNEWTSQPYDPPSGGIPKNYNVLKDNYPARPNTGFTGGDDGRDPFINTKMATNGKVYRQQHYTGHEEEVYENEQEYVPQEDIFGNEDHQHQEEMDAEKDAKINQLQSDNLKLMEDFNLRLKESASALNEQTRAIQEKYRSDLLAEQEKGTDYDYDDEEPRTDYYDTLD